MPANQQKPALQTPSSPRSSSTSRYSNKDGSKFITVPKGFASDSSQPSTPTVPKSRTLPANTAPAVGDVSTPPVNRKKQKRRQKAAAKAAAELAANGRHSPSSGSGNQASFEFEIVPSDEDDIDYALSEDIQPIVSENANGHAPDSKAKKNKRKKKKTAGGNAIIDGHPPQAQAHALGAARGAGMSRDKIWSTSNHEERERIKEFWLGLGEDDRKSLVKVEKDAVLKKMKEQQKHTCSCTVCGRKRTAIEEELEGLYDAYYLELEQFANQGEAPPALPPRDFPIRPPHGLSSSSSGYARQPPSRGRIVEHVGEDDDEELEDVYSEDEVEDDDYSDDEPPEDLHGSHDRDVADFLTFGNSLQVKGGILTVADDLLKNDGKRFIEMMEQLAERRMAREEDAREHFSRGYGHPNGSYSNPHTHPPPEEDEYEEDEDEEEDYEDSQDEEYEDEEEVYSSPSVMPSKFHAECCCQDQMTEEQRMEEGRRMFQIFAARMFEQRVLIAYKEKVAMERQEQLIEELEAEDRANVEQKAKRARTAQRKKEKTAQKKQALAEEKARKEAEKQAEEDARREAELRHRAEQKMKSEARRKEKEAQRKAEEEARLKKEAERQRRIHEQKEKQAEQERKLREAKEREKKLKEEQRVKENLAREQREREAQERREKREREKQEKEARAAQALKEAQQAQQAAEAREKAREEKERTERAERAERAAQKALTHQAPSQPQSLPPPAKRSQQPSLPLPTALPQQHGASPTSFVSPKIPVATPAIPKAPTPIRSRTTSLHQDTAPSNSSGSHPSSASRQSTSPHSVTQTFASPGAVGPERKVSGSFAVPSSLSLTPPRASSKGPLSSTPFPAPTIGMQPPPGLSSHHQPPPIQQQQQQQQQQPPPGFPARMSLETMYGFRPSPSPSMMPAPPPGINAPPGRGFPPVTMPPPGFSHPAVSSGESFPMTQGFPLPKDGPLPSHRRQSSIGFDSMLPSNSAQPIGRPAPIGRPNTVAAGKPLGGLDDAKHLGSRALLEDDDELSKLDTSATSLRSQPLGTRSNFAPSPFLESSFPLNHNPWGPPSAAVSQLFPPPGFGNSGWGLPISPLNFHVGSPGSGVGTIRASAQPRHVYLRIMLCQACKDLTFSNADADGYVEISAVKSHIDALSGDQSITEQDLLNLCDTEGSHTNGGGTFDVQRDACGPGRHTIRWVPEPKDGLNPHFRAVGAPGEIGSPLVGHAALRGI